MGAGLLLAPKPFARPPLAEGLSLRKRSTRFIMGGGEEVAREHSIGKARGRDTGPGGREA